MKGFLVAAANNPCATPATLWTTFLSRPCSQKRFSRASVSEAGGTHGMEGHRSPPTGECASDRIPQSRSSPNVSQSRFLSKKKAFSFSNSRALTLGSMDCNTDCSFELKSPAARPQVGVSARDEAGSVGFMRSQMALMQFVRVAGLRRWSLVCKTSPLP